MRTLLLTCFMLLSVAMNAQTINPLNTDVYDTGKGQLSVTLLGHGSLLLEFNKQTIYVDPYSRVADYSGLPSACLIVITHEHADHLDTAVINNYLIAKNTEFIVNKTCPEKFQMMKVLKNGSKMKYDDITIEAVAAYNLVHKRPDGQFYHPKGNGNGYIFTFGNLRLYVAGDTENTPEMKALKNIDIAFLPMNLPYTMTPEMVADAAKTFKPKYLYPYHYGTKDDLEKLKTLLINSNIQVVIKNNGNDIISK